MKCVRGQAYVSGIRNWYKGSDLVGYLLKDKTVRYTEWDDFTKQVRQHTHTPFKRGDRISIDSVFGPTRIHLRVQIRTLIDGDPCVAKDVKDFSTEWGDSHWLIVGEHLWNPLTRKFMTW